MGILVSSIHHVDGHGSLTSWDKFMAMDGWLSLLGLPLHLLFSSCPWVLTDWKVQGSIDPPTLLVHKAKRHHDCESDSLISGPKSKLSKSLYSSSLITDINLHKRPS
jgi:hypothetical protein